MSVFKPMAEALPNWLISGPIDEGGIEKWRARTGPWQITASKSRKGTTFVTLLYHARTDSESEFNAEDGTRESEQMRHIWNAQGTLDTLPSLIAAAKDEVEFAAAIPTNVVPSEDPELQRQAQRVADALEKKPGLRDQVIRLLGAWKVILEGSNHP